MLRFFSCLIVASFFVDEGSSFVMHPAQKTLPLHKTCIGAYDNLSGSAGIDSLQQTAENVAVGGESQLSEALTDAVKLTQDLDIIELGDQASLQIPSELIVPIVGGVGLVILAVVMSSLFSGSQAKVADLPDSRAPAKAVSAETAPALETPNTKKVYDVSIPYDAAARFAYKNVLRQQGKTPQFFFSDIVIDEAKFAQFKIIYEEDAVKQVMEKKQARERELTAK